MPPKKKTETSSEETTEQKPPVVAPPSDDTDVQAAIDSTTDDGKGDEPVPPSNFESFATEGVHASTKLAGELASEVLDGKWGDFSVSRGRLNDAGLDATAVFVKVNERLTRGAPSAYRATVDQVVDQVDRGEWGSERTLESRLLGAGYKAVDVADILRKVREL